MLPLAGPLNPASPAAGRYGGGDSVPATGKPNGRPPGVRDGDAENRAFEATGGYTHRERTDPGYDSAFEEIYNDVYMENCGY